MNIPRVTEIISSCIGDKFKGVNPIVLDRACTFGTAVHQTLTLHDQDNLGEYDKALEPYLQAWIDFKAMYKPEFTLIEERMTDNALGFTGQPDRIAKMQGHTWVIDFKTGVKSPEQALQTAAYAHLYCGMNPRVSRYNIRRMCVFLHGEGFTVAEYKDPSDKDVFCSMVAVYNWKKNHNIGG
jgi:hypothetical protein